MVAKERAVDAKEADCRLRRCRQSLADHAAGYALQPLVHEPGAESRYGNAAINMAAFVAENATGQPFETLLAERLLEPLGMHDTGFWPSEDLVARLAKTYVPGPTGDLAETPLAAPYGDRVRRTASPAAGLFSVAEDVLRFGRMYLAGGTSGGRRFLSEASIAEMTRDVSGPIVANYSGHGLGFEKPNGEPYSEAHHVIPVTNLARGSLGHQNIMVLCPNHHRQAHYGDFAVEHDGPDHWIVRIGQKRLRLDKTCLPG